MADLKNKKLCQIFLAAVLGVGGVVAGGCGAPEAGNLTAGEKAEIKSIFGDSVNVEVVRKQMGGCHFSDSVMEADDQNKIYIYRQSYSSPDYSHEKKISSYGSFMHEVAHIWQTQNRNKLWRMRHQCHVYLYSVSAEKKFEDYCHEQQASIVEDYMRTFLYRGYGFSNWLVNTTENDLLLQKLVEDQFPAARATRLAAQERKAKNVISFSRLSS